MTAALREFRPSLAEHLSAARLAQRFHELYEALAPSFDYETRPESAVRWEDVPENNRRLMVAVADVLLDEMCAVRDE